MKDTIYLYQDHKNRNGCYIPIELVTRSGAKIEIQDRIASGGNAVVHRCQHIITGNMYAIKFQLVVSEKRKRRFEQEIDFLKVIQHEQLVKYIDDGIVRASGPNKRSTEIPFIIMELAENNLNDYLRNTRESLTYAMYIGQFKGLALALAKIHEKAIHRDIKPENILVSGNTWLISDFGLCKFLDEEAQDLTYIDEAVGPRFWMSPEALNRTIGNADEILKQSDVFQLCAIFWYVVTGRNPFGVVCKEDWDGPESIFEVIFNALSHDPSRRPRDGRDLYQMLEDATLVEAFGA
ncbi:hypothetical protein PAECIP111892_05236 [Paenibacillus auburnensis]|uniref:Protein kinase domain-containing protein n=2 Tax=Paenibacillus auburnensis TaxID=2905649 RepID=A0ABM9CT57_9BACL|nr:hypothetical protein PAECIP111892_05236 [Paenibacillus auburnensis]